MVDLIFDNDNDAEETVLFEQMTGRLALARMRVDSPYGSDMIDSVQRLLDEQLTKKLPQDPAGQKALQAKVSLWFQAAVDKFNTRILAKPGVMPWDLLPASLRNWFAMLPGASAADKLRSLGVSRWLVPVLNCFSNSCAWGKNPVYGVLVPDTLNQLDFYMRKFWCPALSDPANVKMLVSGLKPYFGDDTEGLVALLKEVVCKEKEKKVEEKVEEKPSNMAVFV